MNVTSRDHRYIEATQKKRHSPSRPLLGVIVPPVKNKLDVVVVLLLTDPRAVQESVRPTCLFGSVRIEEFRPNLNPCLEAGSSI